MKKIAGIGASEGIAIGRLVLCAGLDGHVSMESRSDTEHELARLGQARQSAIQELEAIYQNMLARIGEESSAIFHIHIMMLQDEEFIRPIQDVITQEKVNAEYAVWKAGKHVSEIFSNMVDEYMRGRADDVIDITNRLIRCLDKSVAKRFENIKNRIVGMIDLMPSETAQMNPEKILAVITQEGSKDSHSVILARTMGIPAVVGLVEGFFEMADGAMIIVDGGAGEVILEPDKATLKEYRMKKAGCAQLKCAQ